MSLLNNLVTGGAVSSGRRHGSYTSEPGEGAPGQPGQPTYDMGPLDDPTARSDFVRGWDSTLDFVESDTFNYAVTGGFAAVGVYGAMAGGATLGAAVATVAVPIAVGIASAKLGAWAGEQLGNWAMEAMGYQKIAQQGEMPAHVGHPIAHESGWGLGALVLGAVAGLAAAAFVVMTFGTGLVVLAAAAAVGGALAGVGAGFASAAGQYGTNKGVISKGSPNVFFENKPVARITDEVLCDSHGVQKVAQGNMTVFANGLAIARIGHKTTCDGTINDGCKTIAIDIDTNPQQLDIDVGWMTRITRTGLAILNFLPIPSGRPKPGQTRAHPTSGKPVAACTVRGCPADVATGQFFDVRLDLHIPGTIPLIQKRVCQRGAVGVLGKGWASSWSQHLRIDKEAIYYQDPEGVVVFFHAPYDEVDAENVRFPYLKLFSEDRRTFTLWNAREQLYYEFSEISRGRVWLSRIEDRNGNNITFAYDGNGLSRIVHSDGFELAAQSSDWLLQTVHLGTGEDARQMAEWGYSARGHLQEVRSAQTGYLRYYYDAHDRVVRWHDSQASDVSYVWGRDDRIIAINSTSGYMSGTFAYDLQNRVTRFTDGMGATSVYFYDEDGLVWREIDPLGGEWATEWGDSFNVLSWTTPLGNRSVLEYDGLSNISSFTDPEGATISWSYRQDGLLEAFTDAEGNSRQYTYDQRGNLLTAVNEVGDVMSQRIGTRGEVLRIDLPNGGQQRIYYDHLMRPRATTDAAGNTYTVQYDVEGLLVASTDPLGNHTRFDRTRDAGNPLGAVREIIHADGTLEQFEYDSEGRLIRYTDANGNSRKNTHGPFNLLMAATDSFGNVLRYEYDTEARLIAVINAKSERYEYRRDLCGRVVGQKDFAGVVTSFTADADGRTISRRTMDGIETRYLRNGRSDLMATTTVAGGSEEITQFAYDKRGLMTLAKSHDSSVELSYDGLGRVTCETVNGRAVRSEYISGELHRIKREGDVTPLELSYDLLGEVRSLAIANHAPLSFTRDMRGLEVLRQSEAGFAQAQSYSSVGFLQEQVAGPAQSVLKLLHGMPGSERLHAHRTTAGPAMVSRNYQWDPAANLVRTIDSRMGETRYSYDARNQIVQTEHRSRFGGASFAERFAYDPCNNLAIAGYSGERALAQAGSSAQLGETVEQAPGGLIRRRGRFFYRHDSRGRVAEKRLEQNGFRSSIWRFEWDGDDRLVQLETPAGDVWHYGYDALGRRIRRLRIVEGGKTRTHNPPKADNNNRQPQGDPSKRAISGSAYQWDGNQIVAEAPIYADGTIAWDQAENWIYESDTLRPLARLGSDGRIHYIVADQIGTPRELISEDGREIAWSAQHRTWGQVDHRHRSYRVAQANDDREIDCPIRFQGQWEDAESGLYYNNQRYYDPDAAQYLSPDPIGLVGGARPQGYVANPATWVDPLGLTPLDQGGYSLYHITDRNGVVRYVGITNQGTDVRAMQHEVSGRLGPGYKLREVESGLTYAQARGYEQADIAHYKTRDTSRIGLPFKRGEPNRIWSYDPRRQDKRAAAFKKYEAQRTASYGGCA